MGYDAYITRYHRTNKPNTVIVRNDSDINKVVNTVIENQDNFEYEDIDSWCSNGRYWIDFVYDNIDPSLRNFRLILVLRLLYFFLAPAPRFSDASSRCSLNEWRQFQRFCLLVVQ